MSIRSLLEGMLLLKMYLISLGCGLSLRLALIVFFFYIFFWLHVLRVLTTLSFLVQVKLFCRIVSYRVNYILTYIYLILSYVFT